MSTSRTVTVGVFKACGMWWKHRRYTRKGEWRHCYAPRWGEPIFSKTPLRITEVKEIYYSRYNGSS